MRHEKTVGPPFCEAPFEWTTSVCLLHPGGPTAKARSVRHFPTKLAHAQIEDQDVRQVRSRNEVGQLMENSFRAGTQDTTIVPTGFVLIFAQGHLQAEMIGLTQNLAGCSHEASSPPIEQEWQAKHARKNTRMVSHYDSAGLVNWVRSLGGNPTLNSEAAIRVGLYRRLCPTVIHAVKRIKPRWANPTYRETILSKNSFPIRPTPEAP